MLLTCCPCCTSRLIAIVAIVGRERDSVVGRRCPECGHEDAVLVATHAAVAWARRERRITDSIASLTERLANGLAVELSEISAG